MIAPWVIAASSSPTPPPSSAPSPAVPTPRRSPLLEVIHRYAQAGDTIANSAKAPNTLQHQLDELGVLRDVGFIDDAVYAERAAGLRHRDRTHVADTSLEAKRGFGVANQLWKIVHPARLLWSAVWDRWYDNATRSGYLRMRRELPDYEVRPQPVTFYTADNVQLSGFLLRHPERRPGQPLIVMASGNAACAENELSTALEHCARFGADVMVYSPRGVSMSLGDITQPTQSLWDCEAAVRHAATLTDRLLVWGCSLGGALMAETLRNLRATEPQGQVMRKLMGFVCINSFPSLPAIMGQMTSASWFPSSVSRGVSGQSLRWMGINPLDTQHTLTQHTLGVPVRVFNSTEDDMMHGPSNLATALGHSDGDLEVHTLAAGSHNEYSRFLDTFTYVRVLRDLLN